MFTTSDNFQGMIVTSNKNFKSNYGRNTNDTKRKPSKFSNPCGDKDCQ